MIRRRFDELTDVLLMRDAGIRAKVLLALAGVVALAAPQIGLTVAYMVDLYRHGAQVERLSAGSLEVSAVSRGATEDVLRGPPRSTRALEERQTSLSVLAERVAKLRPQLPEYEVDISAISHALVAYSDALVEAQTGATAPRETGNPWVEALEAVRREGPPGPDAWRVDFPSPDYGALLRRVTAVEKALFGFPERVVGKALFQDVEARRVDAVGQAEARSALRRAADAVVSTVGGLQDRLEAGTRSAGAAIGQTVDRADRYLITLVLITLVYIGAVILLLPGRLVQPLRHITSVLRRAEQGQLDVRARVVGRDEMGTLAKQLNAMLERTRTFDELKRDRIYEDRARIHALGDLVPHPLVILDTRHRIEYANRAFSRLFVLREPYEGGDVMAHLTGADVAEVRELLDRTLKRRRPVRRQSIQLTDRRGEHEYLLNVDIGRNRSGVVSYLVCRLEPVEPKG